MNILTVIDEYVQLGKIRYGLEVKRGDSSLEGFFSEDDEKAYRKVVDSLKEVYSRYVVMCAHASIEEIKAAELRSKNIVTDLESNRENLSKKYQWAMEQADTANENKINISARNFSDIAQNCSLGLQDIERELPIRAFFYQNLQTQLQKTKNQKPKLL